MIEQPFDRPRVAHREAILDFADLLGDVDVDRSESRSRRRDSSTASHRRFGGTARSECSAMPTRHTSMISSCAGVRAGAGNHPRHARSGAAAPTAAGRRNRRVMYSTGSRVRPMPASRAASTSASDIARRIGIGRAVGLMMQVVEFADLRVAGLEHFDVELRGDRVQLVRTDAAGEART